MNARAATSAALFTLLTASACGDSTTLLTPDVQFAMTELVLVCHRDHELADWRPLSVPSRAVGSHLGHGDGLPGDPMPGTNSVFGLDCEPVGWQVLVSEVGSSRIRLISSDGSTSSIFHAVTEPRGIAVEEDGHVVVVQLTGELRRIAPDGSSSEVFFSGLSGSSGIAIMPDGDLVVTEDHSPFRLMRVAPDGSSSSVIVSGIKSEDVKVDANGDLLVFQEGAGDLLRVTPAGAVTTFYSGLSSPSALAIADDGAILVAEWGSGTVRRISPDGGSSSVLAGGFAQLEGIAITPDGDLVVSEFSLGQLTRITADGSTSTFFGGLATPDLTAIRPTS